MYIEELHCIDLKPEVVKALKALGVKNVLKKFDHKPPQEKRVEVYHVFKTSLELLEKESTALGQSRVPVHIPVFVIDSCRFIEQNLLLEGLFRKAGSTSRQRELRAVLDCGNRLDPTSDHNVINVANILKLFFRELPEPLIPFKYHDMFLRCLILKENKVNAVLLCCLLLPTDYLNTLAYLMKFLQNVALQSSVNRMDVGNLSIIFTPSIMPVNAPKLTPHGGERINHHVQVVRLLIENASMIGVVPDTIASRYQVSLSPSSTPLEDSGNNCDHHKSRKKKRRSGSLTRMFSGLKKKIIRKSNEGLITPQENDNHVPVIASKKRCLTSLPEGSFLSNTPYRIRKAKASSTSLLSPRLLISKSSYKSFSPQKTKKKISPCTSTRRVIATEKDFFPSTSAATQSSTQSIPATYEESTYQKDSQEYVRIPKEEYEEIKNRVSLIESRIENELDNILGVTLNDEEDPMEEEGNMKRQRMDDIHSAFIKTVEESEKLNSAEVDLSRKFGRGLKIRRSGESRVIRSPSARKIGSIRRRSRENFPEKTELTRHVSLNCERPGIDKSSLRKTRSLRRGRPNTVYSGLPRCLVNQESPDDLEIPPVTTQSFEEHPHLAEWKNARDYFNNLSVNNDLSGTGRESVAKIRSQNIGMVLAKAKLFDAIMGDSSVEGLQRLLGTSTVGCSELPDETMNHVMPKREKENLFNGLPPMDKNISPLKELNSHVGTPRIKQTLSFHTPYPRHLPKTPLTRSRTSPMRAFHYSPMRSLHYATPRRSPRLAASKVVRNVFSPSDV